jgi:hypothetical protein
MYKITIKTKYNVINLEVEDYTTPEVQEILEQPYIIEVRIEKIGKVRKLEKWLKNELHGNMRYTKGMS